MKLVFIFWLVEEIPIVADMINNEGLADLNFGKRFKSTRPI